MFSHPQRPRIDPQASGDFRAFQPLDIEHAQQFTVVLTERLKRGAHLLATAFVDERDQRIGFISADRLQSGSESDKSAVFAPRRAPVVETDISRRLENERRKCLQILDLVIAQRFDHPPQRLLRHILGRRSIAQTPRGENAQPPPKTLS